MLRVHLIRIASRSATYGSEARWQRRLWRALEGWEQPRLRHGSTIPLHFVPLAVEITWGAPTDRR